MSFPASPKSVSFPNFPSSVSFPAPPLIIFTLSLPVRVSLKLLPIMFSMLIKVSFPEPTAFCATKSTSTPAPAFETAKFE